MSNSKTMIISAVMAILAVILVASYLKQKEKSLLDLAGAVPVVVATEDIQEMEMVDQTSVRIDHIPRKYLQPGAVQDLTFVIGKIPAVSIKKGEQILDTKLLHPGTRSGLSFKISKGMRAMTVPISAETGVAQLIRPGDRIDLLSSIDYGRGDREEREVKTVLQNVLILATGRRIANDIPLETIKDPVTGEVKKVKLTGSPNFFNVTLEVDPIQSQSLTYLLTAGEGILFLSLRNPDDRSRYKLYTTDLDRVLGPRSIRGRRQKIRSKGGPSWLEIRNTTVSPGY